MTANAGLKHYMQSLFDAMDQAGCFKQTTLPPAYAKALAAQKAKRNETEGRK